MGRYRIVTVLIIVGLACGFAIPRQILAQEEIPPVMTANGALWSVQEAPQPPEPAEARHEGPAGEAVWANAPDGRPGMAPASTTSTGGPDTFGYTWDDGVPMNWIDATDGTDIGMNGQYDLSATTRSLPFPFRFYEDTYNQVWIVSGGYLVFGSLYSMSTQQSSMPSQSPPNNVIAPFWTPIYPNAEGPSGRIYHKSGGSAPNRYFVVEWFDVKGGRVSDSSGGDETYRFEVVLYENGDILFQYQEMTYNDWRYYASIGIEDPRGAGLGYMDHNNYWSRLPSSGRAILFRRPAPAVHVGLPTPYVGGFVSLSGKGALPLSVRNTGELGADTYDITVSADWPTTMVGRDRTTPLADTDGDGTPDTGSLAQGATVQLYALVQTPSGAAIGDSQTGSLIVRSSRDPSKSRTIPLQVAVPSAFAQTFRDGSENGIRTILVQPGGQREVTASKSSSNWPYNPVTARTSTGMLSVWQESRCINNPCTTWVYEIYYALTDPYGGSIKSATRLTNHSGAANSFYDYDPAIAVAPNGRIGVTWRSYQWNSADSSSNSNMFLAVLDAQANLVAGPHNITNNSSWTVGNGVGVPRYYYPRIVATSDNRFTVAWLQESYTDACTQNCWIHSVAYAVRDTNGGEVRAATLLTGDTPTTAESYSYPALTLTGSGQVFVAVQRYTPSPSSSDLYYYLLSSNGTIARGRTNLTDDGASRYEYWPAVAHWAGGGVIVAWVANGSISYRVLNSDLSPRAGPFTLAHSPYSTNSDYYPSIATDTAGRAAITWTDSSTTQSLYYALVNQEGQLLTSPLTFRTARRAGEALSLAYSGHSTAYPLPDTDAQISASGLVGGEPGGAASAVAQIANHGSLALTGLILTLDIAPLAGHGIQQGGLAYLSNNLGVEPEIDGSLLTWHLPGAFNALATRGVSVKLAIPASAPYGQQFPVRWSLTSAVTDATPEDNTLNATVMVAHVVQLPLLSRK